MTLFSRAQEPPQRTLRDTLFGDLPVDNWVGDGSVAQAFPWSAFVLARARMKKGDREAAVRNWREIVEQPGLEPRHYLQVWHFLRQNGVQPDQEIAKQVLGVVVEVGMARGLDVVAAYPDHSARYINYSGKTIIWDQTDGSMNERIDALLEASKRVVAQIGVWTDPRPTPPPADSVRLNFLTPSGLHFGQASMSVMQHDPIGAPTFFLAGNLMNALIERVTAGAN
ncbi:MAG TPA: hypothetical protein VGL72_17055 [Bryobacteraceae bacterium]